MRLISFLEAVTQLGCVLTGAIPKSDFLKLPKVGESLHSIDIIHAQIP